MLNKNDPLIGVVQEVMKKNQAERDAVKLVNEKFGIQDRKVLPHERQHEWDAAYKSVLTEGINVPDVSYKKTEKNGNSDRTIMTKDTKNVFSGGTTTYHNVDKDVNKSGSDSLTTKIKSQDLGKNKELGGKDYNISTSTVYKSKKVNEEELDEKVKMTKKQFANLDGKPEFTANDLAHARAGTHKKKPMAEANSIIKKFIAKKKMNEGFNNRHDSSVTASVEGQVVAEAAKARSDYGLGAAAAPKDAAAARAKIDTAMKPVADVAKAVIPGATAFDKATQGNYKGAAVDAGLSLAGGALVGGALKAGKAVYNAVKGGSKAAAGSSAAAGATKALPAPSAVKPVSQAAREPASTAATKAPTAVDKFISKARATPVSPAAKEGGSAASTAAANVSKYSKPGTAGGRFSDKLAQARKGSENYGPSKGGVAVRKTTQPATVTRPGVPAVANRPGVPAVANRPGLPAVAGSAASTAAKTSRFGGLGKALKYGGVAAAVGAAAYGLKNKNQPPAAQAKPPKDQSRVPQSGALAKPSGATAQPYGMKTPQKPAAPAPAPAPVAAKPVAAKPVAAKPVAAKPVAAKPVAAKPVAVSAVRSKPQTRDQRDNTVGANGKPTKGPGGVKSGTTIKQKAAVRVKRPAGTGREK
jgi:hypothetical protein